MLTKPIAPPSYQFPLGWHTILQDFALDILTVEYLYGEVVASVSVERTPVQTRLRIFLVSEAPRRLRDEASDVLDQMHERIHERANATCRICGLPVRGGLIGHCGQHREIHVERYAGLQPLPMEPAWGAADFHRLIEGCTNEDVICAMALSQNQMDVATAFVNSYCAPEVSQLLAQAHSKRAAWAWEDIPRR